MRDFRELLVWQKAHQVTLAIYHITEGFPGSELYGLTSQMRRCSVSIPSNIAEGCGRGTDREFAQFLQVALGSASELEYQTLLAYDLGFIEETAYQELTRNTVEIKKMLAIFIQKLRVSS